MSYSADGLLQRFTDPRSNVHRFTYDTLGRLIKDEDPAGGSTTLSRTEQSNGYAVTTATALGRVRSYQVEQLSTGAVRRTVTAPSGAKTVTLINTDASEQTTFADGSSIAVTFGPDPRFGMLAPVASKVIAKTPAGLTRTITTTRTATLADPNNLLSLTSLTDTVSDNGNVSTRVYNNTGTTRTITQTTPAGRSSTVTLDSLGRVTQAQALGLDPVTFTYDSRGLVSAITEGSGATSRTTNVTYNAAFNLTNVTDPLGRTTSFTYDLAGRVTQKTLPDNRLIGFTYDASGNVTSITPPSRPSHVYAYTATDLEVQYAPPADGLATPQTQSTYNLDQQLTRITRPDGELVDLAYDTAGHLSTLITPLGVTGYAYDAASGNLTQLTVPDTTLGYTYDGAFLLSETWSGAVAGALTRTYNNDFNLSNISVDGTNITHAYDSDGLLTQAGALTLSRNAANGFPTGTTLGGVTDVWTHAGFGDATGYSASFNPTNLYSFNFMRDKLGRVEQKVEIFGGITTTFAYGYDLAGRLIEVKQNGFTTASYTYDSNGNRLTGPNSTTTYTYDDQDRLLTRHSALDTRNYSYTANGELLSKTAGVHTTGYQYDALGNLLKVTLPGGTAIDYLVDGRNRRIGKKVNGTMVKGFRYQDGLRPVAELDGSNTVVSRFVYATKVNVPDYLIKGGATYRIITDELGSPRLVVNTTTGQIVQRMDYDTFGAVTSDTNPGFQPFGFAGGIYDRDTNLIRFGLRDYDVEMGRWIAKDPILFAGGQANLYAYVGNDPVNYVDPWGLDGDGWKVGKKWTGKFDDDEGGTVVCNEGKIESVVSEDMMRFTPDRICAQRHEASHQDDITRQTPNICKGVKGKRRIVGDPVTVKASEKKAYTDTISCLEEQLKSKENYEGTPAGWTPDEKQSIKNYMMKCQDHLKKLK